MVLLYEGHKKGMKPEDASHVNLRRQQSGRYSLVELGLEAEDSYDEDADLLVQELLGHEGCEVTTFVVNL
jgi:hypothetical protein